MNVAIVGRGVTLDNPVCTLVHRTVRSEIFKVQSSERDFVAQELSKIIDEHLPEAVRFFEEQEQPSDKSHKARHAQPY